MPVLSAIDHRRIIRLIPVIAFCLPLWNTAAVSGLLDQPPIELTVELGDRENKLRFFPDHIDLESGKLYRLMLHNPSPSPHYFSSPELVRSIFSHKVLIIGADGRRAGEVKGTVMEIEVYPGGTVEWWFVAVRDLPLGKILCSIAGHAEEGMVGTVKIE